jgi:hypothetical protein
VSSLFCTRGEEGVHTVFCLGTCGKDTACKSRKHRWEDIIKKYHKSLRCEIVDCNHLAEDWYMFFFRKGQ